MLRRPDITLLLSPYGWARADSREWRDRGPRSGRRLLPSLRPLAGRHPDRFRRGTGGSSADARRRAAGGQGGPGGPAVRGAGGTAARRRPGCRRDRPAERLRYQRGQAFQVAKAGQTAAPREAERQGGQRLPALAGGGDPSRPAASRRLPGRDRGPSADRPGFQGDARAREAPRAAWPATSRRDSPPFIDPEGTRRSLPPFGDGGLHQGPVESPAPASPALNSSIASPITAPTTTSLAK